jgi:hypothetical protein
MQGLIRDILCHPMGFGALDRLGALQVDTVCDYHGRLQNPFASTRVLYDEANQNRKKSQPKWRSMIKGPVDSSIGLVNCACGSSIRAPLKTSHGTKRIAITGWACSGSSPAGLTVGHGVRAPCRTKRLPQGRLLRRKAPNIPSDVQLVELVTDDLV